MIDFILMLLKPFQILLQNLGRKEPKMNRSSVDLAMSLIKVGDILVTHEKQRITSLFIKGEYDHAAILSPDGVVEAVGDMYVDGVNIGGVRKVDIEEFLFLMDKVAIIRPITKGDVNYNAGCNSLGFVGTNYDYGFKIDKSRIYCSELVYLSYQVEANVFGSFKGKRILPQHFRNICDDVNFKLIFEFK
jgi:uncharacterized protein YycO